MPAIIDEYTALRTFSRHGQEFEAGTKLPERARKWADLRSLQRSGLVSWEPGNPKAAPRAVKAQEVPPPVAVTIRRNGRRKAAA